MRRPPPPPSTGRPTEIESTKPRFSETLWFKLGAIDFDEHSDPTPLPPPIPIGDRYIVTERMSMEDRQQFSLHSHVPPAPGARRRPTSVYGDDDLARYMVPSGSARAAVRRPVAIAAGLLTIAMGITATFAIAGDSEPPAAPTMAVAATHDTSSAAGASNSPAPTPQSLERTETAAPVAPPASPAAPSKKAATEQAPRAKAALAPKIKAQSAARKAEATPALTTRGQVKATGTVRVGAAGKVRPTTKVKAKRKVRKAKTKRKVRKAKTKRKVRKAKTKRKVRKVKTKRKVRKVKTKRKVRKVKAKRKVRKAKAKRKVRVKKTKRKPKRKAKAKKTRG